MYTRALIAALQNNRSSGSGIGALFLIIIGIGLVAVARKLGSSPPATGRLDLYLEQSPQVPLATVRGNLYLDQSPQESIDAVTGYLTQKGYAIAFKGDTIATFTKPKKADTGLGCFLLLLGLIPGLLYFGLFKGTNTTTVAAMRDRDRTHLTITSDDVSTQRDLIRWLREHLQAHGQE